jgi:glucose/mannose-6-phosphate isomerase
MEPKVPLVDNPAKILAQKLYGKFPIIYGVGDHSDAIALRWKQQLNENSKVLAHYQLFPELNHNEIVGWELQERLKFNQNYHLIFLRDRQEILPEIRYRIEITKELLGSKNVGISEVWSQGESLLARLFSLNCWADFTSIYLAVLNNVDPTPVDIIHFFKDRLADYARETPCQTRGGQDYV